MGEMERMLSERFWAKVPKSDPTSCWEWTASCFKNGYGQFGVGKKKYMAHRMAWILSNGAIGDLSVCHKCDNRRCVNPGHLFLGTTKENMADMVSKGRSLNGAKNAQSKLTKDQVLQIRELYVFGLSAAEISSRFGISVSHIGGILSGKKWTHLNLPSVLRSYDMKGETNPSSKLKIQQVLEIRSLRGKKPASKVGQMFEVSSGSVFSIWHRRTWINV